MFVTTVRTFGGKRTDLSSKRAPHRDKTAIFRQKVISGYKSQSGFDTKTY
jgi:hypothetical protein